ncbi:hypothetical protein BCAR13_610036 [Paraburkholderia caribensis]|nr:hypothetical protein BCAR13_610036 [Paraburkholderia caribensis]
MDRNLEPGDGDSSRTRVEKEENRRSRAAYRNGHVHRRLVRFRRFRRTTQARYAPGR